MAHFYEACVGAGSEEGIDAVTVCNWVIGELFRLLKEVNLPLGKCLVPPEALAELLSLINRRVINASTGKDVLAEMFRTGADAKEIIAAKALSQISDVDAIASFVVKVIGENPGPVAQYLGGKVSIFGFFIGQVMRASRGKADPQIVQQVLKQHLDALERGGSAS